VQSDRNRDAAHAAYAFLADHVDDGIVLTGTSKPAHLRQNAMDFSAAARKQASRGA
jgi:hypothetical protein